MQDDLVVKLRNKLFDKREIVFFIKPWALRYISEYAS